MFADLNVRTTLFAKIEFKIVEMCFSLSFLGLLQFVLRSDHLLDFLKLFCKETPIWDEYPILVAW